jgi:uncharacterized membrane protein
MGKVRQYYVISGVFLFFTAVIGSMYRNYIYTNIINDYGLADVHTNIGAVVVASFLFMGYAKYTTYYDELRVILGTSLGFIIYEFIQITPLIGTFDWGDVLGTIVGGLLSVVIHWIVIRRSKATDME